jgi:TatD DNase family protein
MFIDSHCHLNFPELRSRLPTILSDMQAAQVDGALCIATTMDNFEDVHQLATEHPNLWCTVGVHPDEEDTREPSVEDLLAGAGRARVVGIGETGLDYYRLNGRSVEDMAWQRERFRVHIRAARQLDLPLIIHTRSASEDTLTILREEGGWASTDPHPQWPRARGVFHCFTEAMAVAQAALAMDFYVSFSGILTFKSAADLREVARAVPLPRTLIETDSPYLAPVPHRGKTNTPAWVPHVAQCLADIHDVPLTQIAALTRENFYALFNRVEHLDWT